MALVVCCFIYSGIWAQQTAQESKLSKLISEREQLVLQYQYYNQQNSNFWGKKSKKDLLAIVETLKKIINTDTELIAAVKETSIKKIAENSVKEDRVHRQALQALQDQRLIKDRISNLQNQVAAMENQVNLRERKVKDMEVQLAEREDALYGKDKVITVLAVAAVLFLIYSIILQVRLSKAKAKPHKKTRKTT